MKKVNTRMADTLALSRTLLNCSSTVMATDHIAVLDVITFSSSKTPMFAFLDFSLAFSL